MYVRRALYYWQFAAAFLLPLWVLIARGVFGSNLGWEFVLFIVVCPILAVAMLVVASLTYARKSVRSSRTVGWVDVAVLAVWHLAIIGFGFYDSAVLATIVVLVAVAGFWIALWQLFSETRNRVRGVIAGFEQSTKYDGESPRTAQDGHVIILEPGDTQHRP